jgi:hypothetical protein
MKDATSVALAEAAPTPAKRGRPKGARGPYRDLGAGASAEAKRSAAAILEVLAGARTPKEAAQALGLSVPRYYLLESQAMHGILVACEPRRKARDPSPESALAALRRECDQLRRECVRQQALVRAAQRTIGLTPPAAGREPARNGKKRPRRPTARALQAVARLRPENPESPELATASASETV